ncbi:DUF2288 domain-containing protein [Undibacterium sp. TS12]|uniref:DUF2288 domain-containing protein n=1 Tax=Undibacterium sp. TS12 TaxID=2908202 RepID=UPI001F4C5860|nr:DUF2288 domain-containing protein [Undibacterium sp. TS12]MCH8618011.1 DUF2288 domain-containing protein [Undibacterium sp. TS12]
MSSNTDILRNKINLETAAYPWSELLRHFAGGTVLVVAKGQDLVEVALHMAQDQTSEIAALLAAGHLAKVSDEQAQSWLAANSQLWTVVVKPWVLVQERN